MSEKRNNAKKKIVNKTPRHLKNSVKLCESYFSLVCMRRTLRNNDLEKKVLWLFSYCV